MRYRAFKDEVKSRGVIVPERCKILFSLPMPQSWSQKKKKELSGQPHQQKPDLDNLVKALLDAVFEDDAHIYKVDAEKRWAEAGSIEIEGVI